MADDIPLRSVSSVLCSLNAGAAGTYIDILLVTVYSQRLVVQTSRSKSAALLLGHGTESQRA